MERRYNFRGSKQRKFRFGGFLPIILIGVLTGLLGFYYFSPYVEFDEPSIKIHSTGVWNKQNPLIISLNDKTSGIKSYKVAFIDNGIENMIFDNTLTNSQQSLRLEIKPELMKPKSNTIKLIVTVFDNAKWNYFGNESKQEFDLMIDDEKPQIKMLSQSFGIKKGGSAIFVANITDKNLKEANIIINNKYKFPFIPFYKQGNFIAFTTWPTAEKNLLDVKVEAIDMAGNISQNKLFLNQKHSNFNIDKINVDDNFINSSLQKMEDIQKIKFTNTTEAFLYFNKTIREKNIASLQMLSQKMDKTFQQNFSLEPFNPLLSSKLLGDFGDWRIYLKDEKIIDEQWHLGIDLASVKNAPIYSSNNGKVAFVGNLGIYGKAIIIDHGFGIMSLYAHTSQVDIKVGQSVAIGQKIANTGMSGAVLGDHLHFGILINGIESDPKEWLDQNWIKNEVLKAIEIAKSKIDGKNL